jgi:ribonuclease R
LDDIGAQGLVPISTLGAERFNHDERRHTLEGSRSGTTFHLGDRIEAVVQEASPVTGGLVLGLVAHQPSGQDKTGQTGRPQMNRIAPHPGGRGRRRR